MTDKAVLDIRFLYYMPEIDLQGVANDSLVHFSAKLQSFIDMGAGFITFMRDPANRRNVVDFASGISVLKKLLAEIGCKNMMLQVAQLEAAIRNRNVRLRDELLTQLPDGIRDLGEQLKAIPRVEVSEETISEALAIVQRGEETRQKSILVAGNAPDCVSAVEAALDTWFEVHCLSRSVEYQSLLRKTMVDLLILDVGMPELNGFQLLERVRLLPAYRHTPVIMLSGYATPSNLQLAKEMKVDSFIRKPFDSDILVKKACQMMADAGPRSFQLSERKQTLEPNSGAV